MTGAIPLELLHVETVGHHEVHMDDPERVVLLPGLWYSRNANVKDKIEGGGEGGKAREIIVCHE